MSREQGPRAAGMRPAANVAGRRRHGMPGLFGLTEASDMSREQGPRAAGMRPAANVAGRRQVDASILLSLKEAAHA